MKRREIFQVVLGTAGAVATSAISEAALQTRGASVSAVTEMMQAKGLTPGRGEAAQVAMFLQSMQRRRSVDPRVEPAIGLDPETD